MSLCKCHCGALASTVGFGCMNPDCDDYAWKGRDAFLAWNYGTVDRNMSKEKEIALKVRFIDSEDKVFIQTLEVDNRICGYIGEPVTGSLFVEIFVQSAGWMSTISVADPIGDLKRSLIQFAKNNAFHGKEKPVPRIERYDSRSVQIFYEGGGVSPAISESALSAIADIVFTDNEGKCPHIPIHEDKPMFEHEFKQTFPVEIVKLENIDYSHNEYQGILKGIDLMKSKESETDLSAFEFTMWRA